MNLEESKTKENLLKAFAGESQAKNRYTFAAEIARQKNLPFLAKVFEFTASQEEAHAKVFYDFLKPAAGKEMTITASYPVDNIADIGEILRTSAANEANETDLYPEFAKVAEKEGFIEISDKFAKISEVENTHSKRYRCLLESWENNKTFKSDQPIRWMCLNCGYIFEGSTAPQSCPLCGEVQGYFVPCAFAPFTQQCERVKK